MHTKLMRAFELNSGILTVKMAKSCGISQSELEDAAEQEVILKYNNFIYFQDYLYFDDLYFIQLQYPQSIFSHETAVMLHNLSTFSPFHFNLSVSRGDNLGDDIAKEQKAHLHYMHKIELEKEYIEVMDSWDSNLIKVTNLEKTIVDMLCYKYSMPGIVDEMIWNYLHRNDLNIARLIKYGERFDVMPRIEKEILPFIKKQ